MLIAEQAPRRRLLRFGLSLLADPSRLWQGLALGRELAGVSYLTDAYPVAADGGDRVKIVILQRGARIWTVECDYLACGFHLIPNLELASLLGCRVVDGRVAVDSWQRTSVSGIFSAPASRRGLGARAFTDRGEIAGLVATGQEGRRGNFYDVAIGHGASPVGSIAPLRRRRFCVICHQTRRSSAAVRMFRLAGYVRISSWRAAKLQTRCGMGPCQATDLRSGGRTSFGMDVRVDPSPVLPARVETLSGQGDGPGNSSTD
jgi:rhodanese-related sulfurtransferase